MTNTFKQISGGVCAAKGFVAGGIHCGIRRNRSKKDLALIVSEVEASAAAAYTTNLVKGAPLVVTKENISDGKAKAIICNSGNANTCNSNGIEIANEMCDIVSKELNINAKDVVVASTGVIGEKLNIDPIKNHMHELAASVSKNGSEAAANAIMTTDTVIKEVAVSFEINGKECHVGGIAKGSGMIHPNMATMLVFITSDVAISAELLNVALKEDIQDTFNMTSVDGDTSTNDMVAVLANGLAGNEEITANGEEFLIFRKALHEVTSNLCRRIAGDGEGATKLLECKISGAKDKENAKIIAKSIITSSLVKSAFFGADANWGRILCAIGYSGADVDVNKVKVTLASKAGEILVCENGAGVEFSEDFAKKVLVEEEIDIIVELGDGQGAATAWGCDLTLDYVTINSDYRT